jgi:hypothetical protein
VNVLGEVAQGTRKIVDIALHLVVESAWRVVALGSDSSARDIALLATAALVVLQIRVVAYIGVVQVVENGFQAMFGSSRPVIDVAAEAKDQSVEAGLHNDASAAATRVELHLLALQVLVYALDYGVLGHEIVVGLREACDELKPSILAARCVASDIY